MTGSNSANTGGPKIGMDAATAESMNPQFNTFDKLSGRNDLLQHSVVEPKRKVDDDYSNVFSQNTVDGYRNLIYGDLTKEKVRRLVFYREMAAYPEVSDAIDEICDACINKDIHGNIIALKYSSLGNRLSDLAKMAISAQFENFISLYDLDDNGFEYFRTMLIDGEITWENIIDPDRPAEGIIGVSHIPSESYEYLVDDRLRHVGVIVNAQLLDAREDLTTSYDIRTTTQYANHQNYFDRFNLRNNYKQIDTGYEVVPLPMDQVTHVNSGIFSSDRMTVLPVLEKARRPYRQLSLLEDAIIIYRLVRAPERLVFNVATGRLPAHKAEQVVLKMMKRYQSKKVYNSVSGESANEYDPHQMMENYWFPKPETGGGTEVTSISSAQNLGELSDLYYFQRKLFVSLKVPYNRHGMSPESTQPVENNDSINYEEYRFSKFVIRIQQQFSKGLMAAFVTHLKLTGVWDMYNLTTSSIRMEFNPPAAYNLYTQQRMFALQVTTYTTIVDADPTMSRDIAKQKYLGMSAQEIKSNREAREREMLFDAYLQRKIANIGTKGVPDDIMNIGEIEGNALQIKAGLAPNPEG